MVLEPIDDRESIHVRQHEIEDDQIGIRSLRELDGRCPACCVNDLDAVSLEPFGYDTSQIEIIFDQKDLPAGGVMEGMFHGIEERPLVERFLNPSSKIREGPVAFIGREHTRDHNRNRRGFRPGLQGGEGLDAIHVRHEQIKENHVRRQLGYSIEQFATGSNADRAMTLLLEQRA